jgi:hypothetical protein
VVGGRIICSECLALAQGRPARQDHHLFGQHNSPVTMGTAGNLHDALSDGQGDWPADTLRNPASSPLRRAAAERRSIADLQTVHAEALEADARFLERLDKALQEHHGPDWPRALGLDDTE